MGALGGKCERTRKMAEGFVFVKLNHVLAFYDYMTKGREVMAWRRHLHSKGNVLFTRPSKVHRCTETFGKWH